MIRNILIGVVVVLSFLLWNSNRKLDSARTTRDRAVERLTSQTRTTRLCRAELKNANDALFRKISDHNYQIDGLISAAQVVADSAQAQSEALRVESVRLTRAGYNPIIMRGDCPARLEEISRFVDNVNETIYPSPR